MISTTLDLALISTGVLGFRHGFDYDHIAAISDLSLIHISTADFAKEKMR